MAKKSLEKELKYHLDRKSYQRLIRACSKRISKRDRLVTYYFDDKKLGLRKKKFGFRLRTNGGKGPVLTLKYPAKGPARGPVGFKVRHEFEQAIPAKIAKALLKGKMTLAEINARPVNILKKHFSNSYLEKIKVLGSMKTSRTMAKLANKFQMEIDRCETFGKKFYELELETSRPKSADEAVRGLLEKHGIPYLPVEQSKLSRFLDEWTRRRKKRRS